MLQGLPSNYTKMISRAPEMYLIASGGVSSVNDIDLLNEAKELRRSSQERQFTEGKIKLNELKKIHLK